MIPSVMIVVYSVWRGETHSLIGISGAVYLIGLAGFNLILTEIGTAPVGNMSAFKTKTPMFQFLIYVMDQQETMNALKGEDVVILGFNELLVKFPMFLLSSQPHAPLQVG
ncbi:hypothetical protein GG496_001287 [Candidatus Fervidibacteria bacterium JGI MDM2 JNZ-1-D12]